MIDDLLTGRHVLVVEDEMFILMMIEDMLADLGCESVTAAATVDQALTLVDSQLFDVALLDMNLNGEATHLVADALAARGVPFAFASGYSRRDMREGFHDRLLLKKPFQEKELGDVLAQLLMHKSPRVGPV